MTESPLRIVFAGTPEFSARHLQALTEAGHDIVAVYTQPDRPAGRGKKLQSSPVKKLAESANIPVFQPQSLKAPAEQQQLASLGPDLMIVVAYGLILPQSILDTPKHGCINVHASLLPRWRGAAPIQRAIEAGDRNSGTTIMQMDAGLDTGAMLAKSECVIESNTTAGLLEDKLATLGSKLLLEVVADLARYQANGQTQDDSLATYAQKIQKSEAQIDWQQSAQDLDREVRAFNPFPVCFTELAGQRVKVWSAEIAAASEEGDGQPPGTILRCDRKGIDVQCNSGVLRITQLQLPGGKALHAEQVLNARSELFSPGHRFGAN